MNEKIKKLWNEAFDIIQNDLETVERDHAVMYQEHLQMVRNKFAELIVRRVISVYNDSETFKTSTMDDNRVLEYFGVEE